MPPHVLTWGGPTPPTDSGEFGLFGTGSLELEEMRITGEQPGTVDTYVHYLRRKTDPDLVTTVRGEGYRLGQP